jgi:serine/threonine-protein kinase
MQADRWKEVEEIFQTAADLEPEHRPAFLKVACAGDFDLRREVESLLESADKTLGFLQKPVNEAAHRISGAPDLTGKRIGAYRILKTLGEGGMGKVYLAARADDQYQGQVAIKLMHGGFGATQAMFARFRAERQILANLDHPNIGRLLDGGVTIDGSPYLVMEYVDGLPLDQYCQRNRPSLEGRLRLFRSISGAVEYAHKNLVVHRDIKPANILVTSEGVPKLLDFGIAKLLDPDLSDRPATRATERLLTPEYASPEQIRGEPVTTATDVYELGVLLYELLAGLRPFRVNTRSPLEVARMICEQDPALPSVTARGLSDAPFDARKLEGDLDNIVMMALRKEPERRYASVAEFSADVDAYLNKYPVRARTDTWAYRTDRFVRRNKAGVAAAVFMTIALIGFGVAMWILARKARDEQTVARREAQFLSGMFQAASPDEARGRTITARDLLDAGAQRIDHELAAEPRVRASLLGSIASAYRSLGLYDQAKSLAERSYQLSAKTFGPTSPEADDSLVLFATLLRDHAQYQRAEPLFRQLLAARQKRLSSTDPLIADALARLGECLYLENKDREAEPLLRRGLAIDRENGPDYGPEVRNYLALLLERKGGLPEAVGLLQEATAIERRVKGPDAPEYAISLHNLASAHIDMGDLAGAERMLRETLAIRRKILGNTHSMLAYTLNNLGYVLIEQGDPDGAEQFLLETLAINLRTLGSKHPRVAINLGNLGRAYQLKGDYTLAAKYFDLAQNIVRNSEDRDGFIAAQLVSLTGMLAFDQGDYAAAERLARRAMEMRHKLGADNTPAMAASLLEVGEARVFQNDPRGAEPLLRQALKIRSEKYFPEHPFVIAAEVRLGEALTAAGEADQAEPILRRAAASARNAPFALLPWQIAEAESALGSCLAAQGRLAEATPLLRESSGPLQSDPRPVFRHQTLSAATRPLPNRTGSRPGQ